MKKVRTIVTFVAGVSVGFISCGALAVRSVLKSDELREAAANVLADKIAGFLVPEVKDTARKERISYMGYYYREEAKRHNRMARICCFNTRREAEDVLSRMDDLIVEYGFISLEDFYELCGAPHGPADHKYGWKGLDGAEVILRDGMYEIKLPTLQELDEN
jgi:hypothetical protein